MTSALLAAAAAAAEPPIRVALYESPGARGMQQGLPAAEGFATELVTRLDEPTLFRFDIVALGSVKGLAQAAWLDALELYVRCGGGLLLTHDATGCRGWDAPPIPEDFFRGISQGHARAVRVRDAAHPAAAGLPPEFQHRYMDHIALRAGARGRTILADADGAPLAVAAEWDQGRLLGCGLLLGYAAGRGASPEQAPEGPEALLLKNAARWLGAPRLSALDPAALAARRQPIAAELARRGPRPGDGAGSDGLFGPDWYTSSMLNEQGYVHPPVELLPGRFFLVGGTDLSPVNRGRVAREPGEIRALLRQLKWLGVTDIIAHTGGITRPRYPTRVPGLTPTGDSDQLGVDYLEALLEGCHAVGLDVWCFWHPKEDPQVIQKAADKSRWIRNAKGEVYGPYIDIKSPVTLELARRTIDELAERYNRHGNLKGIFLDELWHAFGVDKMEGWEDRFAAFCQERFGEAPPADLDLKAKFALGREWHAPENVWWRRYALYRNTFPVAYIREVTRYANSKGLRTMPQIGFGFGWWSAHGDTYNLARAADVIWTYEHRNTSRYENYPPDRVICGVHTHGPAGYNSASMLRANYGSQFVFNMAWQPIGGARNPFALDTLARQIRVNREWYGARPLSTVAVLANRLALDLSFKDSSKTFEDNDTAVQLALSSAYHAPMLIVQDAEFFAKYRVLVAPRYSLRFLPESSRGALAAFLEQGGSLVLLDADITTAREDHTGVKDWTESMTGVRRRTGPAGPLYAQTTGAVAFAGADSAVFEFPAVPLAEIERDTGRATVLATANGGSTPAITETPAGKGRIVSVHFDLTRLLADRATSDRAVDLMRAVIERGAKPPLRVRGNVLVYNAIQKGNWVSVAFLSRDSQFDTTLGKEYPARARLFVDMKALGVDRARYKVVSLARDREMMPQGRRWNFNGGAYWTAESLANEGIEVYIPRRSLQELAIPARPDDVYASNDYVQKYVLPRWSRFNTRSYEHELIAIAPADEASMLPEPGSEDSGKR